MASFISWHIVTSAEFKAGTKVEHDMYFLSDTHEIYRGSNSYTQAITMYTELPAEGALGRLYINSTTLEGKMWNGSSWTTVINPVADSVAADGVTPVSGKAVAAYVAAEISKLSNASDTVSALSWDSAEHILTVTKGDASSETITFEGLGVSLQYTAATGDLQLVDAAGTPIGDAINLDLEKFVTAGEYDAENKKIILYFDAEKTNFVEIDAAGLVDTYTAEGDNSLSLTVENNVVKGSVKISTAEGNAITVDENGLYVAPVDVSGKMDKIAGGVNGNLVTIDDNGNVVDSGKSFDDLVTNIAIYEGASIDEAVNGNTPKVGDVCVVITPIISGDAAVNERKEYQYNGSAWVAMDEAYSAKNVYIPGNITMTKTFGRYAPGTTGTVEVPGNKSWYDMLVDAFCEDTRPSVTKPYIKTFTASVTAAADGNSASNKSFGAFEVGTNITPEYSVTFNAGAYGFEPKATGIVAGTYNVSDTNGNTGATDAASGTFPLFQVTDDLTSNAGYKITATVSYEASDVMPKTALGNDATADKITAGTTTAKTSSVLYGYRKSFWGVLDNKNTDLATMDSAFVRALTGSSTAALTKGSTFDINIKKNSTMRIVLAYPASIGELASVKDENASNAQIVTNFTKYSVSVNGANGYDAIAYFVYVMDRAEAAPDDNVYHVTL